MYKRKKVDYILGEEKVPDYIDIKIDEAREIIKKENKKKKVVKKGFGYIAASLIVLAGIGVMTPIAIKAFPNLEKYLNNKRLDVLYKPLADKLNGSKSKNRVVCSNKSATITIENATIDDNLFVGQVIIESDFLKKYNEYDINYRLSAYGEMIIDNKITENLIPISVMNLEKVDDTTAVGFIKQEIVDIELKESTNINLKINQVQLTDLRWKKHKDKDLKGSWDFDLTLNKVDKIKEIDINKKVKVNKEEMGLEKITMTPISNYISLRHKVGSVSPGTLWWAMYNVVDDKGNTYKSYTEGGQGDAGKYYETDLEIIGDLSQAEYIDVTPYWNDRYIENKTEGISWGPQTFVTTGANNSEREEIIHKRPITKDELNKDTNPRKKYPLKDINYYLNVDKAREFLTVKELIGKEIPASKSASIIIKDIVASKEGTKITIKVDGDYSPYSLVMFDEAMNDIYNGVYTDNGFIDESLTTVSDLGGGLYTFVLGPIDINKKYKIAIPMDNEPQINPAHTIRVYLN